MMTVMSMRMLSSSFDPDEETLHGTPVPLSYRWRSLEDILVREEKHTLLVRTPLFWQTETLLHYACRAAEIPLFVNEPENIPAGVEACVSGDARTILTERVGLEPFVEHMLTRSPAMKRVWIVIHRPYERPQALPTIPTEERVYQEIHVLPGVPVFTQCEDLADTRAEYFHKEKLSEELPHAELPTHILADARCACGEELYTLQ